MEDKIEPALVSDCSHLAERLLQWIVPEIGTKDKPGTEATPERFVKALIEITTPEDFEFTTFEALDYNQMLISGGIEFFTLCEHHVLPFFGEAYIGVMPDKKIAGLSKLARTVQHFAAGLNTQEYLTKKIGDFIQEKLEPNGVGVILRATHMCQSMRGVKKTSVMTTSHMTGAFLNLETKEEFLRLVGFSK